MLKSSNKPQLSKYPKKNISKSSLKIVQKNWLLSFANYIASFSQLPILEELIQKKREIALSSYYPLLLRTIFIFAYSENREDYWLHRSRYAWTLWCWESTCEADAKYFSAFSGKNKMAETLSRSSVKKMKGTRIFM